MIEVLNLTKRYGENIAVDNISFTVDKGQIYGFLGPNGAGKSTIMNILTGYLAASEGEVIINDHDILKEPEKAKASIGYLPELPPLYQDMTVKEQLTFVAELRKIDKEDRESVVLEAMNQLNLNEVSQRLIKNLSKGYKQRVGFAQAILSMPEILILDEPTVGLDPKQIIEIRDLIKKLGEKHTILLSSHILSEVSAICDHVIIISKGKLVASDTPENLKLMLDSVTTLNFTIMASVKDVENAISKISDLEDYSIEAKDDKGNVNLIVKYKSGNDFRGEISEALVKAGCTILQMSSQEASLEDIFMELVESDTENSVIEEQRIDNIDDEDKNLSKEKDKYEIIDDDVKNKVDNSQEYTNEKLNNDISNHGNLEE